MDDDALIDLAGEMCERDAGKYLGRFWRYPAEDDGDDEGAKSWESTWKAPLAQGVDEGHREAAFEARYRGWLGCGLSVGRDLTSSTSRFVAPCMRGTHG